MDTKLTLTLDKEVIERAKVFAKSKNRSLSDLVENYFKALIDENGVGEFEVSESVRSLRAAFKKSNHY